MNANDNDQQRRPVALLETARGVLRTTQGRAAVDDRAIGRATALIAQAIDALSQQREG